MITVNNAIKKLEELHTSIEMDLIYAGNRATGLTEARAYHLFILVGLLLRAKQSETKNKDEDSPV